MNRLFIALTLIVTGNALADDYGQQIAAANRAAEANAVTAANQGLAQARQAVAAAVAAGQGMDPGVQANIRALATLQNQVNGEAMDFARLEQKRDTCDREAGDNPGKKYACFVQYNEDLRASAPLLAGPAAQQKAALDHFQQNVANINNVINIADRQLAAEIQAVQAAGSPTGSYQVISEQAAAIDRFQKQAQEATFDQFARETGLK